MTDRLQEIKARIGWPPSRPTPSGDATWLISMVEGLREQVAHHATLALSAHAEVERLRGLLARLEWPETLPGAGPDGICPVCSNPRDIGHESDCWLPAELGARREP